MAICMLSGLFIQESIWQSCVRDYSLHSVEVESSPAIPDSRYLLLDAAFLDRFGPDRENAHRGRAIR